MWFLRLLPCTVRFNDFRFRCYCCALVIHISSLFFLYAFNALSTSSNNSLLTYSFSSLLSDIVFLSFFDLHRLSKMISFEDMILLSSVSCFLQETNRHIIMIANKIFSIRECLFDFVVQNNDFKLCCFGPFWSFFIKWLTNEAGDFTLSSPVFSVQTPEIDGF